MNKHKQEEYSHEGEVRRLFHAGVLCLLLLVSMCWYLVDLVFLLLLVFASIIRFGCTQTYLVCFCSLRLIDKVWLWNKCGSMVYLWCMGRWWMIDFVCVLFHWLSYHYYGTAMETSFGCSMTLVSLDQRFSSHTYRVSVEQWEVNHIGRALEWYYKSIKRENVQGKDGCQVMKRWHIMDWRLDLAGGKVEIFLVHIKFQLRIKGHGKFGITNKKQRASLSSYCIGSQEFSFLIL